MKPKSVIKLSDIKKVYKTSAGVETHALRGVNLDIREGDFVAIMGASGSGKSSLMNLSLKTSPSGNSPALAGSGRRSRLHSVGSWFQGAGVL